VDTVPITALVSPNEDLSFPEKDVLDLLARGYLYKEIADALIISVPPVNTRIRRVYAELHVRSRGQAVARYAHFTPSPEARNPGV